MSSLQQTGIGKKFRWKHSACIITAICFLWIAFHFQKERAFVHKIQGIPLEDRVALEAFFRILILEEGGAYVLFGDKPVAFTAYLNECRPSICSKQRWDYYSENQKISSGWKTWEKYRNLFPSKNFILECNPIDDRRCEVCLINRRNFLKIAEENSESFQLALGNGIYRNNLKNREFGQEAPQIFDSERVTIAEGQGTSENQKVEVRPTQPKTDSSGCFGITPTFLLSRFQKERTALFNVLQRHHALLGILLGFGTKNAWMFHEDMGDDPDREDDNFALNSHIQRYSLESVFGEHNHKKCYKFLRLPYFLVDTNSEETHALRKKYLKQRQEIHKRYAHGDFLEASLRQMTK